MVQKQLPALTWLSHGGQRQRRAVPLMWGGQKKRIMKESLHCRCLYSRTCFILASSQAVHSCTGAAIKGPNVEGRVWLSPKMSDTNALFMQKAYNAPWFLSSEQIAPLSTSATWFFISDTCLCFFSTSKVRWLRYLHEIFAQAKFPSNAR